MSRKITIHQNYTPELDLSSLDPYILIGIKCKNIGHKYIMVPRGDRIVFSRGDTTWLNSNSRDNLLRHVYMDERVKIHAFETLDEMTEWLNDDDDED